MSKNKRHAVTSHAFYLTKRESEIVGYRLDPPVLHIVRLLLVRDRLIQRDSPVLTVIEVESVKFETMNERAASLRHEARHGLV